MQLQCNMNGPQLNRKVSLALKNGELAGGYIPWDGLARFFPLTKLVLIQMVPLWSYKFQANDSIVAY